MPSQHPRIVGRLLRPPPKPPRTNLCPAPAIITIPTWGTTTHTFLQPAPSFRPPSDLLTVHQGCSYQQYPHCHHNSLRSFHSTALPQCPSEHHLPDQAKRVRLCRSCSAPVKDVFQASMSIEEKCKCQNCGSLIPVDQVLLPDQPSSSPTNPENSQSKRLDYFGLFGIEKKFDVDLSELKRSYHRWQQVVHPDFIRTIKSYDGEDVEQAQVELQVMKQWSMAVNRAKGVLSDNLERAEYLIGLDGRIMLSQEADSLSDPELLMEVMELQERLEEARTEDEIKLIKKSNQQSIQEILNDLNQSFQKLNQENGDQKQLEVIKRLVIRLRYLRNI